jgi:hypothetical protein
MLSAASTATVPDVDLLTSPVTAPSTHSKGKRKADN